MNILILNWYDLANPLAGGAERYLFEIFSRLACQGHRVTLTCQDFPGSPRTELLMGIRVVRLPASATNLPIKSCQTIWNSLLFYTKHRQDYNIVVDCVNKMPHFTPLYVDKEKRVALQYHFNGATFCLEYPRLGRLLQTVERAYFRLFYTSERFIVISPSTQADLVNYGICPDQSVVIYPAVECPAVQSERTPKPTIVYIGRLQRYKSLDVLLRAMVAVVRQIPEVTLRIVGHGRDKGRLEKLASELGIESRVIFEGYVSEQMKWQILASAWLHVNPSRKEGWGITVLEAARYGVPSVASRVPGLCDSVKDGVTGRLVDYGDVSQLADAIVELLRNHQLRMEMGNQACQFSRGFTWDVAAQQMACYLEHLLERQVQRIPLSFLTELRFPNPL